jgi:hypothetical protein
VGSPAEPRIAAFNALGYHRTSCKNSIGMPPFADDAWQAWSPEELFIRLRPLDLHWYVAGGWALDLWHGRQSRPHDDLEFCVLPKDSLEVRRALGDIDFFVARSGNLAHLAATEPLPEDAWQLWGADRTARCWRVDLMIERGTPDLWVYKRDPQLTLPRSQAIRASARGIPYLAPSIVLLFKARAQRDKDEADFRKALPRLSPKDRNDLRGWLTTQHPGHGWIKAL